MVPRGGRFLFSSNGEPHRDRTKAILKQHPEIRSLIGHNPYTVLCIAGLVILQLALAWWVAGQPWWIVLLIAYLLGAFVDHALYVLMHETNHNLLFRRRYLNTLAGILANLPSVVPSSVSFQRYHLKHHAFQGVHELDGDMPSHWEAKLIGNRAIGKMLWLLLFPVFLTLRPTHLRNIALVCRWTMLNVVVMLVFDGIVWATLGSGAFFYLVASMFFSIGLHPVGARWIQEHFVVSPPQETYSYYGPMNRLAFNIGYHNEHHDFPGVPWNRVPRIRAIAPEWYDGLEYHTSWTRLLVRFVCDPRFSLYARVDRRSATPPASEVVV
jgi:sphingolipid 4-desaturase/C4-monooxygenase